MRGFFCTNPAVKNSPISIYHNVPLSEQGRYPSEDLNAKLRANVINVLNR